MAWHDASTAGISLASNVRVTASATGWRTDLATDVPSTAATSFEVTTLFAWSCSDLFSALKPWLSAGEICWMRSPPPPPPPPAAALSCGSTVSSITAVTPSRTIESTDSKTDCCTADMSLLIFSASTASASRRACLNSAMHPARPSVTAALTCDTIANSERPRSVLRSEICFCCDRTCSTSVAMSWCCCCAIASRASTAALGAAAPLAAASGRLVLGRGAGLGLEEDLRPPGRPVATPIICSAMLSGSGDTGTVGSAAGRGSGAEAGASAAEGGGVGVVATGASCAPPPAACDRSPIRCDFSASAGGDGDAEESAPAEVGLPSWVASASRRAAVPFGERPSSSLSIVWVSRCEASSSRACSANLASSAATLVVAAAAAAAGGAAAALSISATAASPQAVGATSNSYVPTSTPVPEMVSRRNDDSNTPPLVGSAPSPSPPMSDSVAAALQPPPDTTIPSAAVLSGNGVSELHRTADPPAGPFSSRSA
mmetsp:Transcript_33063/g.86466  ORF Transcript_33063/g.86466 Transcript_33063/m.86466 type:complete len:486 (+) Transcript_33063:834-2291(+)